jgi:hypothetical protein
MVEIKTLFLLQTKKYTIAPITHNKRINSEVLMQANYFTCVK